ncbi:unnamed protein product [Rotaria sp. Silwood1]|nr:unnamed protein product [Rotaria sp. Silwood1]
MPDLCYSTVKIRNFYLDGHQWKENIVDYLAKIERFRFRMHFTGSNDLNKEEFIDHLLDTFRTPFWLDKRRWFVRCEWSSVSEDMFVYSLPLTSYRDEDHEYLNDTQLSILANSLLGRQCEILSVDVENQMNIIYLVKNMVNLRALICRCYRTNGMNSRSSSLPVQDEFITWLQDYLSPECDICKDYDILSRTRIWIH